MERRPRVTEIKVRMDCNGCIHKIKKALNGVDGISDTYIDFHQQKITIIGWADPETLVKAFKKTRKTAVICLHTETPPSPDHPPPDQPPEAEGGPSQQPPPPPEHTHTEPPPPPPQPPKEQPPPQENPPPEPQQSSKPENTNPKPSQPPPPSQPKNHEEIQLIHHHPPGYSYPYGYGPNFNKGYNGPIDPYYRAGPQFRDGQPQPVYVTHNYNAYKPSPNMTEYAYPYSPPRYTRYGIPENYTRYGDNARENYYGNGNNGNANVTSMFSEEDPNACTIV